MEKFAILADVTCDLVEEFQQQFDIHVLHGYVIPPNKQEVRAMPDWDWCTREEFYRDLKRTPEAYTTAPPNVNDFYTAMEEYAQRQQPLLVMTLSGGMSGTHAFAQQARTMVLERYSDAKIYCFDSRRFGPGFGLMAVHAALCRERGMSFDETVAWLEDNKSCFHQAGWHEDLAFVAKKGRITHAKAFFGTLAGVRPLGEFDANGMTTVITKVKGTRTALRVLQSYIEATATRPEEQVFFVGHSNRPKQAAEYKALIEERFHPKACYISDVHASCGVNAGPGLVAAYYMGKPISKDLEEERKLIERLAEEG